MLDDGIFGDDGPQLRIVREGDDVPDSVVMRNVTSVSVGDQADLAEHTLRAIIGARITSQQLVLGDDTTIDDKIGSSIVYDEGDIYGYDPQSGTWRRVSKEVISSHVQRYSGTDIETIDAKGKPSRTGQVKIGAHTVAGVVKLASDRVSREGFFAGACSGFACTNGFVRVSSDGNVELEPHSPTHRARESFAFAYDPETACPKWKSFLLEGVFRGDPDARQKAALLGEFVGAAITGNATRFQKVLILRGDGSNGKSVFLKVISRLLPERSLCSIAPQQWGDDRKKAHMVGRLLNVVGELPDSDIISSENFKAVVTGDPVNAEAKYKDPFDFSPRMGNIFNANRLPGTSDTTAGFWRRFLLVEFTRNFENDAVRQDPDVLVEELCQELQGILSWALRGVSRRFQQKAYTLPQSHIQAMDSWRVSVDQVRAFADECLKKSPPTKHGERRASIESSAMYLMYRAWAEAEGHRHIITKPRFRERLLALGFEQGRPENRVEWYAMSIRPTSAARP
jgi:P4 family phage/plasmid primase-like protien